MVATLAAAAGYAAAGLQHPELLDPLRFGVHTLTAPLVDAGDAARDHLVVDSLLLIGAGGWYIRSAHRGG